MVRFFILAIFLLGCESRDVQPLVDGFLGKSDGKPAPLQKSELREKYAPHRTLDYRTARRHLFSKIDNFEGKVTCVYSGLVVQTDKIPDHRIMNTEHTWPRSRMEDEAETDLHNLFPAASDVNKKRSNIYFGDVVSAEWERGGSKLGKNKNGKLAFEIRKSHRGNAARAMFYISTVYGYEIPPWEEEFLRRWHVQDPVDAQELERNNRVEAVQGNRNPFVDDPDRVARISDF